MEVKPGYKQSEVGVIPEGWRVSTLGQVCSFENGDRSSNYPSPGSFRQSGIPFINAGHVAEGQISSSEMNYITQEAYERLGGGKVKAGDILFCLRGSLGKFGVVSDNFGCGAIASSLVIIRPKAAAVSLKFLICYFSSAICAQMIDTWAGGAAQPNLGAKELARFSISLPPSLPEQRAIATALSDVDALLGALDRLIAKKRDLKQAAMQQLLTGQTRLPGFHGEWEVKRLGEVATFFKGKGLPKSALIPDGSEPCIHYGELFTRYPETIGEILSRTNGSRDSFRSFANDVLMPTSDVTPRGLAKASCVTVDGVILGGDILVIRSDLRRVFGSFLSYIIRREEDQVLRLVTGSTVYHLYGSDMKKFTFALPPLPEQTAIAAVLSEMDAELAVLEQRQAKTRALKQGMMQELLTGRTRLL